MNKTLSTLASLCIGGLLSLPAVAQQMIKSAPLALNVEQGLSWTPDAKFTDKRNVSQQPLLSRFVDRDTQLNVQLNPDVKVLIAPDGMDNFGNYLTEQPAFNLFNFTHWAQIDVLNWFAGTADNTINIPARPWVEAAHKNGVKVIGSVYLAVAQWGGSADTAAKFLVRDKQGRFPMAHKLIEIADFYGFDGWLVNQETDLSAVKDEKNELIQGLKDYNRAAFLGREMLAFMKYLKHITPKSMEIHWYDAQILDGTVRWQNVLNEQNAPFFGSVFAPASDAIFLNYWWDQKMVQASHDFARKLRRDPYEVYTGVDLWPARNAQKIFSHTQWLEDIYSDEQQQGLTSIALFGTNVNFNFTGTDKVAAYADFQRDAKDVQRYYDTETRLFAGDDLNMAKADTNWSGLSRYLPARSVITELPFSTSFNTGHGMDWYAKGESTHKGQWHDMAKQDLLPSWQFAVLGDAAVTVQYDFDKAWTGGSSLKIKADKGQGAFNIPLYKTQLLISEQTRLEVKFINKSRAISLELLFSDGSKHKVKLPQASAGWSGINPSLQQFAGRTLVRVGLSAEGNHSVDLNLGQMVVGE